MSALISTKKLRLGCPKGVRQSPRLRLNWKTTITRPLSFTLSSTEVTGEGERQQRERERERDREREERISRVDHMGSTRSASGAAQRKRESDCCLSIESQPRALTSPSGQPDPVWAFLHWSERSLGDAVMLTNLIPYRKLFAKMIEVLFGYLVNIKSLLSHL